MPFHRVLHYLGRKVFTLQTLPAREEKSKSEQLAKLSGFSLRCRASMQRLRVYPDNRTKGYRSGDVGKIKGGTLLFSDYQPLHSPLDQLELWWKAFELAGAPNDLSAILLRREV